MLRRRLASIALALTIAIGAFGAVSVVSPSPASALSCDSGWTQKNWDRIIIARYKANADGVYHRTKVRQLAKGCYKWGVGTEGLSYSITWLESENWPWAPKINNYPYVWSPEMIALSGGNLRFLAAEKGKSFYGDGIVWYDVELTKYGQWIDNLHLDCNFGWLGGACQIWYV